MPGKKVQCASCTRMMRSDNLKRHVRSCKGFISKQGQQLFDRAEKNVPEMIELPSKKKIIRHIPHFNGEEFSGKKQKSRETMEKIMEVVGVPSYHRNKISQDIIREENEKIYEIVNDPTSDEEIDNETNQIQEVKELEERFRTLLRGMENKRDKLNHLLQDMLRKYLITEDEYVKVKLACKL